ncbi:MAG: AmmeMemoRadiSam system protein B, partial [Parcubacteria group bacterium]
PKRIILIGPNHYERGGSLVLTTSVSWRSGTGTVSADRDAVQWLTGNNYAVENDAVFVDEHSITAITPYISYYLPDTQIVPMILKAEVRLSEVQSLSRALDELVDDDTVVIAAVDFSHYLTATEAAQNDLVTERALQEFDYQTLLSFGAQFNDYVDSPGSIALLLYWLSSQGVEGYTLLEHTNSGILTGNMLEPVTSYFEVVYYSNTYRNERG